MTVTRPHIARHAARPLVPLAIVALLLVGLLPPPSTVSAAGAATDAAPVVLPAGSADVAPAPDLPASDSGPIEAPSTAYEQWLEHEHDRIPFTPGARVSVGFAPRAGDAWPVGDAAPRRLPPGRASGREMALTRNGVAWAHVPGKAIPGRLPPAVPTPPVQAPVDAPLNGRTIAAHGVSAVVPATAEPLAIDAASGLRRQVYGFLPYWEVNASASRINYNVLSTIAYFSVGASANGNLKKRNGNGSLTTGWAGWTSSAMTRVINTAHRHHTRVVLTVSVFAWTGSQASVQKAILGSPGARLNLVRQVVAAVRDRGADGVNLDFEPLARGYSDEFVKLLRTFRTEFNRVRRGYSIVYDTTAFIGNYPLEASVGRGAADAIFVMGYDYRIGSSSTSGSIDPLSGPSYDLADTIRAYRARVPASRLILGIPWYGRAWSTETASPRSRTLSGAKYGYSTAVNYENVLQFAARYGRRWDPVEQSSYVAYRRRNCTGASGCVTSWRQIWYDDAASLKRRYQLVNDYNLRGAGMWALGYEGGRGELYRAVAESFLVDRAAPVAGIRSLTTSQGDEGFVVRWTGKDASGIASYDVQVSVNGGRWKAWLSGTRATSAVFSGRHGAGFAFRVRAKDRTGRVGSWNVGSTWDPTPSLAVGSFGRVVRDGLAYRAGPRAWSVRLGSIKAGTVVAVTRGPVKADGYTWYEVTQPIREWTSVGFVERGVWVAVAKGASRYVVAAGAPNATIVNAGIRGLDFGASGSPSGLGTATAATAARAFSPDGDGSEDGIRLRWTNGVAMRSMRLNVLRLNGTLIGTRTLPRAAAGARSWTWDGTVRGTRVKDGTYLLQLVGTSRGHVYRAPSARPATADQTARYAVRVDTRPPVITAAAATRQVISPNGDGVDERTTLRLVASGGAMRWVARITDASGRTVRSTSGAGDRASITWAGTTNAGRRVPDGRYTVTLSLYDNAGNAVSRRGTLVVDTTGPVGIVHASVRAFSPNGDGMLDSAALSWAGSEAGTGTARLIKGSSVVRTWKIRGTTSWSTTWDGRRADGTRVADGVYVLRVSVRDAAGNLRTTSTNVTVDRTLASLAWSRDFEPHDGDTLTPTSTLSFRLARRATLTLRIYDEAGRVVRSAFVGRTLAAGVRSWTWNGRRTNGTLAPQGRYRATVTVRSALTTIAYSRLVWSAAFAATTNRSTVRAGQTLTVRFRSVEKLATRPRVTFTQPGRAAVTLTATRLADGSFRAAFRVRSGRRGAASIRILAKDVAGNANTTTLPIRVAS